MSSTINFDREFASALRAQYGTDRPLNGTRRSSFFGILARTAIVGIATMTIVFGYATTIDDADQNVATGTTAKEIGFCVYKSAGWGMHTLEQVHGQTVFNAYAASKAAFDLCRTVVKANRA